MGYLPSRRAVQAVLVVLFVVVTLLRFSTDDVGGGYALLYTLPIAIAALQYGLRGGLAASTLALALVVVWGQIGNVELTTSGYLTRALTFFLLGALVGIATEQRRQDHAERAQLLARVEGPAWTDELTGLLNRRAWKDELAAELERARRAQTRFVVALLDLDRFKAYNDRYGHPAGDELLRQAAAAWSERLRRVDTLVRYGGEEFAVLVPGCTAQQAPEVIDRLRKATPADQTVSAGIAEWDGSESAEALTARADRALYEAKRAGRDRCVLAEAA